MFLENVLGQNNLKFREIAEKDEDTTELSIFLALWLPLVLNLEHGIAPTTEKVYRIGPANNPCLKGPRYIFIKLINNHKKYIQEVILKGFLIYQEKNTRTKPITSKLLNAMNIRYKYK